MSSILAKIYSTSDSWRRAVVDVINNPVDAVNRTAARMKEDSSELQANIQTALPVTSPGSKSVLTGKAEKDRAWTGLQSIIDNMMGMGIIVPAEAAFPTFKRLDIADLKDEIDIDPSMAYDRLKAYRQPLTGKPVVNISDAGQMLPLSAIKSTPENKLQLRPDAPARIEDLIDISRYPQDLQEYFKSLSVRPQAGGGASFSAKDSQILLGPTTSVKQLTSNLLHEMQHGSQYLYDMPRGGSPRFFYKDYGKFSTAKIRAEQLLDQLNDAGKFAGDKRPSVGELLQDPTAIPGNVDYLQELYGMLHQVDKQAFRHYSNLGGEVESRLVQELYESGTDQLPTSVMRSQLRVNPSDIIRPEDAGLIPKVDSDPVTQSLINTLIGPQP